MRARRAGSSLFAAIVVLLLLDCAVLGTLQLAMLERRLAADTETALRLRFAAQTAAHATLAAWPAAAASIAIGEHAVLPATVNAAGLHIGVRIHRLGAALFLVHADAARPPPLHGRASFGLLVTPPPLPVAFDAVGAALSAAFPPALAGDGVISGGDPGCAERGDALRLPGWLDAAALSGAAFDGTVGIAPAGAAPADVLPPLLHALRARADSSVLFVDGDHELTAAFTGILVVAGDLVVTAGVQLHGILFVGGSLILEAGARLEGAAHVAGLATVRGTIALDACTVRTLLVHSALQRARPASGRSVVPLF